MSAPSKDAWRLARLLTARAAVPVEVFWEGNPRGPRGGWHVAWCDGPTCDGMREMAAELASQAPSVAGAIRGYDRGASDLGRVAALLSWLEEHPAQALYASLAMAAEEAHGHHSYPDRGDLELLGRARALLSQGQIVLDALAALREQAKTGGWPRVLQWLDGISAAAGDPSVPSLAAARQRLAGGVR